MSYSSINRVVLIGRLTRDPELRALPSGQSVCNLRVACNGLSATKASTTTGPNSSTSAPSGAGGERGRYMRKGSRVAIDGRLEWHEWETAEQPEAPGGQRGGREHPVPRRRRRRARREGETAAEQDGERRARAASSSAPAPARWTWSSERRLHGAPAGRRLPGGAGGIFAFALGWWPRVRADRTLRRVAPRAGRGVHLGRQRGSPETASGRQAPPCKEPCPGACQQPSGR